MAIRSSIIGCSCDYVDLVVQRGGTIVSFVNRGSGGCHAVEHTNITYALSMSAVRFLMFSSDYCKCQGADRRCNREAALEREGVISGWGQGNRTGEVVNKIPTPTTFFSGCTSRYYFLHSFPVAFSAQVLNPADTG